METSDAMIKFFTKQSEELRKLRDGEYSTNLGSAFDYTQPIVAPREDDDDQDTMISNPFRNGTDVYSREAITGLSARHKRMWDAKLRKPHDS